jgi:hypothetical protein
VHLPSLVATRLGNDLQERTIKSDREVCGSWSDLHRSDDEPSKRSKQLGDCTNWRGTPKKLPVVATGKGNSMLRKQPPKAVDLNDVAAGENDEASATIRLLDGLDRATDELG